MTIVANWKVLCNEDISCNVWQLLSPIFVLLSLSLSLGEACKQFFWKILFKLYLLTFVLHTSTYTIGLSHRYVTWGCHIGMPTVTHIHFDQIGRFIGLWANFQSLWQQLICPNLPHSSAIFVKVPKSLIFYWNHCWATFIDIWQFFLVTLHIYDT